MAKKTANQKYNRMVKIIAALLIALCLVFIGLLIHAAQEQAYLIVFVLAFVAAIVIIVFTARDMMK